MAAPDMEVIKEIPGYKVILKAVLKSQIQQLVEQLASHTDEQSVILTASVSDGTLSHLGSDSGKSFLQDHEDIKSQFLGFCLKREHKRKQEEEQKKIEKEREEEMQRLQSFSPRNMGPRPSRFSSPRHEIHPVRLSRAVGGSIRGQGVRHEPYGLPRPRARSLNLGPQGQTFGGPPGLTRMPLNKEVIKVEPTDSDGSNQSAADVTSAQKQSEQSGSQPSSPSSVQTLDVKPEHADDNSTSANEASDMKFSDTQPAEGLGLDSDLSNLISGEQSGDQPTSSVSSDMDPNVNIKLEAISENDMELEITGVEPGMSSVDTNWAQNTAMGYDPSGATGNQADMQGQEGYNHADSFTVGEGDNWVTLDAHSSAASIKKLNSLSLDGATCALFTADEMLAKKVIRGSPTEAQSCFSLLIREAAEFAGLWNSPPTLTSLTEQQRLKFFDFVLRLAPQLDLRVNQVWKRLGQALQNRRKYLLDKHTGKRVLKGSKIVID